MKNITIDRFLKNPSGNKDYISECVYFGELNNNALSNYHIAFGVDGSFTRHALLAIQSIINNSENIRLHFHIITREKGNEYADLFNNILAGSSHVIHTHTLPETAFSELHATDVFPHAIYYRLLAPYILAEERHVLYLDADIVCLNSFTALFDHAECENKIAVVVNEEPHAASQLAASLAMKYNHYFNSGVLLINTHQWRESHITERVISLLESRGKQFTYMDQDALNIVLEGQVAFAEQKYNQIFKLGHHSADYAQMPDKDTVFLHYAGIDKPWQQWNKQAATQYYRRLHEQSAWSALPFDKPRTDQQAKKMYKLCFKERAFFSGIKWYLSYYLLRYYK